MMILQSLLILLPATLPSVIQPPAVATVGATTSRDDRLWPPKASVAVHILGLLLARDNGCSSLNMEL